MFTLDAVRPWGRSFDEYQRMLALSDADLHDVTNSEFGVLKGRH